MHSVQAFDGLSESGRKSGEALFLKFGDERGDIGRKETGRDGNQDNAEELTHDVDAAFAQKTFDAVSHFQYEEHPHHVERERREDVDSGIFGAQGDKRGERSGSGQQREDQRDESRFFDRALVLEDFDV